MKFLILVGILATGAYANLSVDEAKLVKTSWNHVKTQKIEILYAVFKENVDIQAKFVEFAGKNLDSVKESSVFKKLAEELVAEVSKCVEFLGNDTNEAATKTLLDKIGKKSKDHNATKHHFEEFKTTVVKYLKAHAGGWTDATANAWNKAFEQSYKIIFTHIK